jgi:hypothetical protein
MTNENELKDLDMVIYDLNTIKSGLDKDGNSLCFLARVSGDAINLIKSQQSRVELLESAIRELLVNTDSGCHASHYHNSIENLRKLMENKS